MLLLFVLVCYASLLFVFGMLFDMLLVWLLVYAGLLLWFGLNLLACVDGDLFSSGCV